MVKKQIDPKTTESDSAQPRFHQRAAELQAYGTVSHALPLELDGLIPSFCRAANGRSDGDAHR